MNYIAHILVMVLIYWTLAVSLDLVVGHLGLLSVAHAALFGLGAYSSTLLSLQTGWSFLTAAAAGGILAALFAIMIPLASLRLRDDVLVLATFAFQVVMQSGFANLTRITRGPMGISGIPALRLGELVLNSPHEVLILAVLMGSVAWVFTNLLTGSQAGRVWHAIREDALLAESLGKNVFAFRCLALSLSAFFAAFTGGFFARYVSFIEPSSFSLPESVFILSIVIIGGAGSRWGSLVSAFLLVTMLELFRFIGAAPSLAASLRQIFYGLTLVLLMIHRPSGLSTGIASRREAQ